MSKVRLKWNRSAMYDLRRNPNVVTFLEAMGTNVRDNANRTLDEGVGYAMSSSQGRKGPSTTGRGKGYQGRWAVRVYTSSDHAKRSNAINNTLLRLLN